MSGGSAEGMRMDNTNAANISSVDESEVSIELA